MLTFSIIAKYLLYTYYTPLPHKSVDRTSTFKIYRLPPFINCLKGLLTVIYSAKHFQPLIYYHHFFVLSSTFFSYVSYHIQLINLISINLLVFPYFDVITCHSLISLRCSINHSLY